MTSVPRWTWWLLATVLVGGAVPAGLLVAQLLGLHDVLVVNLVMVVGMLVVAALLVATVVSFVRDQRRIRRELADRRLGP